MADGRADGCNGGRCSGNCSLEGTGEVVLACSTRCYEGACSKGASVSAQPTVSEARSNRRGFSVPGERYIKLQEDDYPVVRIMRDGAFVAI